MDSPDERDTMRRLANVGLIAAFVVFLWLPTADTFLHLDRSPAPNENRAPARFPEFDRSIPGARKFLAGLEAYFSDHFGFRNRLVRWEQHWKWRIFRDSKTTQAIAGRDGWMFFSGGLMINDVMGNRPFSEAELEAWRHLLTARRDWLAQRGIRYLFVIPPDKHSIYPEHLPEWLATAARPRRRLDQFVEYMKARCDVPVLDLRDALLSEKKAARVYFRTDTHWNERGAFAATRAIAEKLASLGVQVAPLQISAFQPLTIDLPAGDLARMLGRESSANENGETVLEPRPPLAALELTTVEYPPKTWIPGTEPQVSENPGKTGKVVVFRDSFAISLAKFFGFHFNRVVYVWQQNWDRRIIEREQPDLVIDEMLERFVITRDPRDLRAKDDQPDVQVFGER
jgi:hypothetical protein